MKIKEEDILKPGVVLEVKEIDFTDPKVKKFVEHSLRKQKEILQYGKYNPEAMRKVITI